MPPEYRRHERDDATACLSPHDRHRSFTSVSPEGHWVATPGAQPRQPEVPVPHVRTCRPGVTLPLAARIMSMPSRPVSINSSPNSLPKCQSNCQ